MLFVTARCLAQNKSFPYTGQQISQLAKFGHISLMTTHTTYQTMLLVVCTTTSALTLGEGVDVSIVESANQTSCEAGTKNAGRHRSGVSHYLLAVTSLSINRGVGAKHHLDITPYI